ncbi:SH3 domain-containing protein [Deinococcus sp.]|uniref:SH3 domain-containing protein n=1 Tax=Deinococcus sp. TaxID=47478 RepID=UPI0028698D1D|nr:SH3 domain-containing protein [Deinococcus sp.]
MYTNLLLGAVLTLSLSTTTQAQNARSGGLGVAPETRFIGGGSSPTLTTSIGPMFTTTDVDLLSAPLPNASVTMVLPKDTVVEVYSCGDLWCNVKALDSIGWVLKTALAR